MTHNPVGWFELYVQDMERARKFYEAVFQVALTKLAAPIEGMEMWAFPGSPEGYGAPGALVKMAGFSSSGCSTLIYFSCQDCAVEESRVVAAGGRIKQAKMSIAPYGFISLVFDTENTLIGLHSRSG